MSNQAADTPAHAEDPRVELARVVMAHYSGAEREEMLVAMTARLISAQMPECSPSEVLAQMRRMDATASGVPVVAQLTAAEVAELQNLLPDLTQPNIGILMTPQTEEVLDLYVTRTVSERVRWPQGLPSPAMALESMRIALVREHGLGFADLLTICSAATHDAQARWPTLSAVFANKAKRLLHEVAHTAVFNARGAIAPYTDIARLLRVANKCKTADKDDHLWMPVDDAKLKAAVQALDSLADVARVMGLPLPIVEARVRTLRAWQANGDQRVYENHPLRDLESLLVRHSTVRDWIYVVASHFNVGQPLVDEYMQAMNESIVDRGRRLAHRVGRTYEVHYGLLYNDTSAMRPAEEVLVRSMISADVVLGDYEGALTAMDPVIREWQSRFYRSKVFCVRAILALFGKTGRMASFPVSWALLKSPLFAAHRAPAASSSGAAAQAAPRAAQLRTKRKYTAAEDEVLVRARAQLFAERQTPPRAPTAEDIMDSSRFPVTMFASDKDVAARAFLELEASGFTFDGLKRHIGTLRKQRRVA